MNDSSAKRTKPEKAIDARNTIIEAPEESLHRYLVAALFRNATERATNG